MVRHHVSPPFSESLTMRKVYGIDDLPEKLENDILKQKAHDELTPPKFCCKVDFTVNYAELMYDNCIYPICNCEELENATLGNSSSNH